MTPTAAQRQCILDDLAKVLRKPRAGPILTPGEVIALALNATSWIPGLPVEDGDMVIFQMLRLLRQAGYAIVPATKEDTHKGDDVTTKRSKGR